MATTPRVFIKRSSVVGKVPTSGSLNYGELAINFADGKLYYKDDSDNIRAFIDSARVQAIADAIEVVANAQLDSGEVTSLIDSSYVQARVPITYLQTLIDSAYVNLRADDYTGFDSDFNAKSTSDLSEGSNLYYTKTRVDSDIASSLNDSGNTVTITINNIIQDTVDSDYVLARVNEAPFLDSAAVIPIIDSHVDKAFVDALNVDADTLDGFNGTHYLNYQNLTNKPTILDTVDVSNIITTDVDKAFVDALNVDADTVDGFHKQDFLDAIDSAIDALIDGAPGALDTLNELAEALNDDSDAYNTLLSQIAQKLDSAQTIAIIDSAYVQLRQDYAYASLTGKPNILDSADIQAFTLDSAEVVALIDSAYVQARQLNFDNLLDSAEVTSLVDSAYVQARQITYNTSNFTDSAFVTGLPVSTFTNDANYLDSTTVQDVIDSAYVQARQDYAYGSLTGVPTNVSQFTNDANYLDSSTVQDVIDATYIQANQTTYDFLDSAEVTALIDSAYVQARQIDSYNASSIVFDNTETGYVATNVQSAIDEMDDKKLNVSALAGNVTYYPTTDSSEVAGYFQLVTTLTDSSYNDSAVNVATGVIDSDDIFISSLISDANTLVGNTGVITVHTIGNVRRTTGALTGNAHFYYEIYRRDSSDVEHYLAKSSNTAEVDENTYEEFFADALLQNVTFSTNDKVVLKFYGSRTTGFGSPEFEFQFGGDNPVRTLFPVPVSVIPHVNDADEIIVATSGFSGNLGPTDDDVQAALNTLDALSIPKFGTDYIDSATVIDIINSEGLDSDLVIALVDSAYIQLRDRFQDSSLVTSTVDSSYIQIRVPESYLETIIDSAYVNARVSSTDSTAVVQIIDSHVTQTFVNSLNIDADNLDGETGTFYLDYNNFSNTPTIPTLGNDFVDSNEVTTLIDSDYIELRRPAETIFNVVNNGASAYTFTGDGFSSGRDNPTLYLTRGKTYKFAMAVSGHPFQIRVSNGGSAYNTGVTNNGAQTGDIFFTPDMNAPNSLVYQCTVHSGMVGDIIIIDNNIFLDSASTTSLIDSAYIQARQSSVGSGGLDSALVTQLIDSAYVQARQTSGGGGSGVDSAATIALIDSAHVQIRVPESYLETIIDSDYILRHKFVPGDAQRRWNITTTAPAGSQQKSTGDYWLDRDNEILYKLQADDNWTTTLPAGTFSVESGLTSTDWFQNSPGGSAASFSIDQSATPPGPNGSFEKTFVMGTSPYNSGGRWTFSNPVNFSYFNLGNKASGHIWKIGYTDGSYAVSNNSSKTATPSSYTWYDVNDNPLGKTVGLGNGTTNFVHPNGTLTEYIIIGRNNYGTRNYDGYMFFSGSNFWNRVGEIYDSGDIKALIDSDYIQTVQLSVSAADLTQTNINFTADSGQVSFTGLNIDSDKFQVYLNGLLLPRSDYTHNSSKVDLVVAADSGDILEVIKFGGNQVGFDSASTISLIEATIDSAYINARVSFDSDTVTQLVDSAYIQLRHRFQEDSNFVTNIVDSSYIQLRQSNVGSGGLDSALVTQLIDSAYVQARTTAGTDSAATIALIEATVDSAYVQLREAAGGGGTGTVDSAYVQSVVDSAVTPFTQDFYHFTADSGQLTFSGFDDDSETLSYSAGALAVYLNGILLVDSVDYTATNGTSVILQDSAEQGDILTVLKFGGNTTGVDSTDVIALIDSAYIQARQTTSSDGLDSALTTQLIDSAYVQARQSSGLSDIVDDTTPQLGGHLDGNGYDIFLDDDDILAWGASPGRTNIQGKASTSYSSNYIKFNVRSGLSQSTEIAKFTEDDGIYTTIGLNFANWNTALNDYYDLKIKGPTSNSLVANETIRFPDSSGTVALTKDVLDSAAVIRLITANAIDSGVALQLLLDSIETIALIDSDYVRLRVTKSDLDMEGNKVLFGNVYDSVGALPSASSYHGMFAHVHATGAGYFAHAGSWVRLANQSEISTYGNSDVTSLVDSAYVQARQSEATNIDSIGAIGNVNAIGATEGQILKFDSATQKFILATDATGGGGSGGLDSALVSQLIDSAYVQARQSSVGSGGLDSALVSQLIDSDYIGTKVDFTRGEFVNEKSQYTATASQTVFNHSSIDPTHLDVYLNGILQVVDDDYTATSSAVTFTSGVDSGYSVTIVEKRGRVLTQRGLVESKYYFTTATPTTSITGADDNGITLDYSVGNLDVYLNGILLKDSDDYSTNSGTTVTLVSATDSNDLVTLVNRKGVVVTPNVKNYEYTATAGQLTFSGADINSQTLAYVPDAVQVYLNGILLRNVDYTAVNGTSIILADSATLNDELVISAFSSPGQNMDLYKFTADSGQTIFNGNDLTGASLAYNPGNIQVFMNGLLLNDSDDYTASNGMSVVLTEAANINDEIKIASFVSNTTTLRTNAWSAPTETPVTASAGDKLFIDTSSAKTVTLPSSASMGDEIRIIDVTGNAATNNITVSRNGHNIQGAASDLTININRAGIGLVYYNTAEGWVLIEN